ncbi:hypothetical protein PFISCL1PPCAC_14234 [Pristionchus fissidentatus]|uniref:Uncharacterized protein n=1 Tax=Pristionchus fissidentatus TaxID=1538716 RepID=A0AAV5VW44_9BILA|nr:hypothetical protein PFISCL1PPCAC_14234 [Pristionchus fissidentatus]
MKYPVYTVDAFTSVPFAGNQAAVFLCDKSLGDDLYKKIAAEFNFSETAYPVPLNEGETFATASEFRLRWFTPAVEAPLCGHATLATTHVLINELGNPSPIFKFHTLSGVLTASKNGDAVELNFPAAKLELMKVEDIELDAVRNEIYPEGTVPTYLSKLIRATVPEPIAIRSVYYTTPDKRFLIEVDEKLTCDEFLGITPNISEMLRILPDKKALQGVMLTMAPTKPTEQGFVDEKGVPYDYGLRFFAPWSGINEDPACGSAQCSIAPFWSKITGKQSFFAYQPCLNRGGQFKVTVSDGDEGQNVSIVGSSKTTVRGEMEF